MKILRCIYNDDHYCKWQVHALADLRGNLATVPFSLLLLQRLAFLTRSLIRKWSPTAVPRGDNW